MQAIMNKESFASHPARTSWSKIFLDQLSFGEKTSTFKNNYYQHRADTTIDYFHCNPYPLSLETKAECFFAIV
ncbi:MAG: hypothetical protein ACJAUP_003547 [Cellvibrionaceae bacterium]|jgi:hypothetical protein